MSLRPAFAAFVIALAAIEGVASAHHAFAPVYDAQRIVTVQGVVTEFRFINPHSMMSIDVTDDTGKVVKWTVEFDGVLNLTEGGWTERSVVAGERLTVSGNPTHTNSPRMFFRRLVRADGSEVARHQDTRGTAIDEQRRQRARERSQQKQ
jgi:Family of unknown function (DUF6152)